MQFIRNIRMRTKLIILLISISLLSVIAISGIAWFTTQAILQDQAFERLVSVRSDRKGEIENQFALLRAELSLLRQDATVTDAMQLFTRGFMELENTFVSSAANADVSQFYEAEFLPFLEINLRQQLEAEQFMPSTTAGIYLQNQYIVRNENPIGSKYFLDFVRDESTYSDVHKQYHPFLRTFLELFGYYDLFLIEPENRNIVYSVHKEVDFATSLQDGPYATSGLAEVVDRVLENATPGDIQVADFSPYNPSYQAPAAFFATPLFVKDKLIGVVAIQVPLDEINDMMTSDERWGEYGLGVSGETYLVGEDFLMRSMSRLLIEDKGAYLNGLAAAGVEQTVRDQINNLGTSVLLQEVRTESAENALNGETGIHLNNDYRGIPTLSAYAPLDIDGLNWVVIAEMDKSEITAPIIQQQSFFLIAAGGLSGLLVLLSILIANQFTRPLRTLTAATRQIGAGNLAIESIPVRSKDEVGQLAIAFNQMAVNLGEQHEAMQETARQNDRLLLSILPDPIADRVKQGEHNIAEEVKSVTLMFAHLCGVHGLSLRFTESKKAAEMLNALSAQLEEAATEIRVERQPTLSNRYMAVCGLNQQGSDHVERMVRYALTTMQIIEAFNQEHELDLSLQIGIHTGTVLAALLDNSKFRFDLWGSTIEVVDRMEAAAQPGMILVSNEVYERVETLYEFKPHDAIQVGDDRRWRVWELVPPDESTITDRFAAVLTDMGRSRSLPPTLKTRQRRIGFRRFGRKKV